MTEYNTGWSSHLLNVSLFVVSYCDPSALVMSWYDPSIAPLVMSLCVVSAPHILSSSTLPPYSQGEVQPPLIVMRHPSYILQILDSSSTWVRNGNMPETLLSMLWQRRLRKRPCSSPFIHVLTPGAGELGGAAVFVLFCAHSPSQESVHGNQVTIPTLVSP